MATSPAGTIDLHDWRRILEVFLQGFLAWLIPQALAVVPLLNWGRFEPAEMILVLVLTEAAKRYAQAPVPPVE